MEKKVVRKAIIPAAGMGTRFLPATKATPKEMLPILDKPTLQYIVEEAYDSGITDILIILGRGKECIADHFDYSVELEAHLEKQGKDDLLSEMKEIADRGNVHFIRQKEAKGLGHAVLCAETFVGDEPFVVLLGDDVITADVPATKQLIDKYNEYQNTVVALIDVDDRDVSKYGIISGEKVDENTYKVSDMIEKPCLEDAPSRQAVIGRYVISPKIFEVLKQTPPGKGNEIQLTDALLGLTKHEDVYAYKFDGDRYDIGHKFGFVHANIEFGLKDPEIKNELKEYLKGLNLDNI